MSGLIGCVAHGGIMEPLVGLRLPGGCVLSWVCDWCKLFQLGQLLIRLSTIFSQDNQGDISVNYGYVFWVLLRGYPRSVHRFASALSSTGLARDLSLERFEWVLLFLQGVPLAAWNLIISVLKKKWFTDAVLFIIVISTYIINYKLNVYPRFKYLSSLNFEIELN